jgi:hypothetical protein
MVKQSSYIRNMLVLCLSGNSSPPRVWLTVIQRLRFLQCVQRNSTGPKTTRRLPEVVPAAVTSTTTADQLFSPYVSVGFHSNRDPNKYDLGGADADMCQGNSIMTALNGNSKTPLWSYCVHYMVIADYSLGHLLFWECLPGILWRRPSSRNRSNTFARYHRDEKSVDESEDYFDSEFLRGWSLFEFSYAIFLLMLSRYSIGGWLAQCFRTACTLILITF